MCNVLRRVNALDSIKNCLKFTLQRISQRALFDEKSFLYSKKHLIASFIKKDKHAPRSFLGVASDSLSVAARIFQPSEGQDRLIHSVWCLKNTAAINKDDITME